MRVKGKGKNTDRELSDYILIEESDFSLTQEDIFEKVAWVRTHLVIVPRNRMYTLFTSEVLFGIKPVIGLANICKATFKPVGPDEYEKLYKKSRKL